MITCPVCQHENEDGSEYCEECGVKLEADVAASALEDQDEAPADSADVKGSPASVENREFPEPDLNMATAGEVTQGNLPALGDQRAVPSEKKGGSCSSCGADIEGSALFCPQCGNKLEGSSGGAGPAIRLKMVSGRNKDRIFETPNNEIFIGRMPENDISLESDAYVSSRHTRIFKEGDDFFVEDLGSTNGTFVKVRKMTRLVPGDEVKVGQSIFKIEE